MATFTINNSEGTPFETQSRLVDNSSGTPFSMNSVITNSAGTPFVIPFYDSRTDTLSMTTDEIALWHIIQDVASTLALTEYASFGHFFRAINENVSFIGSTISASDPDVVVDDDLTLTGAVGSSATTEAAIAEALIFAVMLKGHRIHWEWCGDYCIFQGEIETELFRIGRIAETLALIDAYQGDVALDAAFLDGVTFSDGVLYSAGGTLIDALSLQASATSNSVQAAALADALLMRTAIKLAFEVVVSENFQLTSAAVLDKQFGNAVRDICSFAGLPVAGARVSAALSVIFDLMDTQEFSFGGALQEVLSLTSDEDPRIAYRAASIETLTMVGDPAASVGVLAVVSDDIDLSGALDSFGLFEALVQDELTFSISFFDGREQYSGWVVNSHNFAVTEYLNYEFDSFAKIGGEYFAAGPEGLFKLHSADDDDGVEIDAVLRTGKLNVGNGHQSRVEHAYLGVESGGQLLMKTITGDEKVRWYRSSTPKAGLDNLRVKLGRGVKSAYWQFEVANIDGQDIEIENMQFFPVILTRRS